MDFKPPKGLIINENASSNWSLFKQRFDNYLIASGNEEKKDKVKIAMLLSCIGDDGLEIYNNFVNHEKETIESVVEQFDAYFSPRKNVVYNRYKFFTRVQEENESIDHYVTALKSLAKHCDFKEEDSLIRDRIVIGISDKQLQEALLREGDLTLEVAVKHCRAAEVSKQQSLVIQGQSSGTNAIGLHVIKKKTVPNNKPKTNNGYAKFTKNTKPNQCLNEKKSSETYKCLKCGTEHTRRNCPAYGKTCKNCGLMNHYAIGCLKGNRPKSNNDSKSSSQTKRRVHEATVEPVEEVFIDTITTNKHFNSQPVENQPVSNQLVSTLNTVKNVTYSWMQPVIINNKSVQFKLDSGAQCNVLPCNVFEKLNLPMVNVEPNNTKILSYDNNELDCIGSVVLDSIVNGIRCKIKFVIVKTKSVPILGLNACVKLNLMKRVSSLLVDNKAFSSQVSFINMYKNVFTGVGKFPKKLTLELKDNATPMINSVRRIPESVKNNLKDVLNKLVNNKIIEPVDYPTDWVNNIVIVEKPDKSLRICLDPAQLNECIKLNPFPIPSRDEIELLLKGKSYFTVLDMKDGFHQIELDHNSSLLTTFITPFGKYKYNKLPFGLRVSPEIFQKYNMQIFGDIPNVGIYFDDFIIATESEKEHNEVLSKVMNRALENNVKFNAKKLQFKVNSVKYLGMVFSVNGVSPEPERVKSIVALEEPKNKKELQSVLGAINFLSKFVHNMSQLTEPLRQLLKNGVEFNWTSDHTKSFDTLKSKIAEATSLKIFDPKQVCEIYVDSSNYGFGACLLQNNFPIAFASKALTETEMRYPIIDKEMAAVCFALAKYHKFIYGQKVVVYTDHKPLVSIVTKNMHKVSSRLQKFKLAILKYNIEVKYLPGKSNVLADLLSRKVNYKGCDSSRVENSVNSELESCVMVHSLSNQLSMSEGKKQELKIATQNDVVLRSVVNYVHNGWPDYKSLSNEIKVYHKIKNDISYEDGLLFFCNKIIVPTVLRQCMLNVIHESHLGVVKCKSRARQILYWPNINNDVERFVLSCKICEKYRFDNGKEPLLMHEKAKRPWQFVYSDILEFGGENFLVVTDSYSNWIELRKLYDKSSSSVISILKDIFSQFGVPERFVSDNVPFNSHNFKLFADEYNFEVITSSPFYPRSNGRSEKAVGICKNLLKRARDSGKDIGLLLLDYRNTALNNINVSPAQLFLNRILKSKMPVRSVTLNPKITKVDKDRLDTKKSFYYNRTANSLKDFVIGDSVLFKKGSTWVNGQVIKKLNFPPRSFIVKDQFDQQYRRNRIMLRKSYNKLYRGSYHFHNNLNDQTDKPHKVNLNNESQNVEHVLPQSRYGRVFRRPAHLNDYVVTN